MNHDDHVALLRDGIAVPGGVWADFGAGSGAFTLALADLLGPGGQIWAIDKKEGSLQRLRQAMARRFPAVRLVTLTADYTQPLELPLLDGVVMANALHFQRRKGGVLQLVRDYLRPGGRLILVEYNVDRGNLWVPHPLSYASWQKLAARSGFVDTRLLNTKPSSFLQEFYAALSIKPASR